VCSLRKTLIWLLCLYFKNRKCQWVTTWLKHSYITSCSHPGMLSQKYFHLAPLLLFSKLQMPRSYHLTVFLLRFLSHPSVFSQKNFHVAHLPVFQKTEMPRSYHLTKTFLQCFLFTSKCVLLGKTLIWLFACILKTTNANNLPLDWNIPTALPVRIQVCSLRKKL